MLDAVLCVVDSKHVMQHLDEEKPEGIINEAGTMGEGGEGGREAQAVFFLLFSGLVVQQRVILGGDRPVHALLARTIPFPLLQFPQPPPLLLFLITPQCSRLPLLTRSC